jgi:hypothetical protein
MKIKSLTPENEAAKADYIKKWIAVGHNTDRLDYDETLDIVNKIQTELLDRKKSPVIIVDNPILAWIACHIALEGTPVNEILWRVDDYVSGKTRMKLADFVNPFLDGSFGASLFSFYDYVFNELKIKVDDNILAKYKIWEDSTKLGMIFPLDNVCIVSQKPLKIKINEEGRVHADCDGPAIEYAGAFAPNVWSLDGITVPQELAETPSHELNIQYYNSIKNADVKMAFVKKYGVERMLELGTKIDTYENYDEEWWTKSEYELWDMKKLFVGVKFAPHLKMLNQTTGVWHVEAVSPRCRSLQDAIKERFRGRELNILSIS